MIDPKKIEQIARQMHESIPKGLRDFGSDIEKKLRQILQIQLMKLNLVSREDFDVQIQLLLKTNEKLEILEQRLNELENLHISKKLEHKQTIQPENINQS